MGEHTGRNFGIVDDCIWMIQRLVSCAWDGMKEEKGKVEIRAYPDAFDCHTLPQLGNGFAQRLVGL